MRKYIFSVLIALLSLPVIAQQQQSQAKAVLDRTADAFRKAGGVKADFVVKAVTNGLAEGAENGTIQLKGEKFVLKTSDVVTWFDGKTQWSYVAKNDEACEVWGGSLLSFLAHACPQSGVGGHRK